VDIEVILARTKALFAESLLNGDRGTRDEYKESEKGKRKKERKREKEGKLSGKYSRI
jgi:hypothetical protein